MISVPPHTHSDSSPLAVIGFVTQVWMWFDGRVWEVDVASVLVQEEVINNPDYVWIKLQQNPDDTPAPAVTVQFHHYKLFPSILTFL